MSNRLSTESRTRLSSVSDDSCSDLRHICCLHLRQDEQRALIIIIIWIQLSTVARTRILKEGKKERMNE